MLKIINRFESPVEALVLLFIFIASLCFFVGSFQYSENSRVFPMFTSLGTMICSVVYSAKCLSQKKDSGGKKAENEKDASSSGKRGIIISVAFFIIYILISYLFGFLIASVIFALFYPLLLKYKKPVSIVISLIVNTAFVLGFQKLLGISLSRGILLDLTRFFF